MLIINNIYLNVYDYNFLLMIEKNTIEAPEDSNVLGIEKGMELQWWVNNKS